MPDHRSGERPRDADEPSLTPLFRRLGDDLRRLVRQEIDLARTELRANAQALSRNALLLCAGLAVGLLGLVVLFAFLLVCLGALLGNYWLSALLLGGLFFVVGAGIVLRSRSALRRTGVMPALARRSLEEDAAWLRREVQELERDLRR